MFLEPMPSLTYLMINSFCLSQIKKEAKIEPSSRPLTTSALVVSLQEKKIEEKRSKESNYSIMISQNATHLRLSREQPSKI